MAIDTAIAITEVCDDLLKFHGCFGQVIYRECHVLNETGSTDRTHSTNRREDTRTNGPIFAIYLWIFCELCWDIQPELAQGLLDCINLKLKVFMCHGLRLGQDGSKVVIIAGSYTFNLASIYILLVLQIDRVIDRSQR